MRQRSGPCTGTHPHPVLWPLGELSEGSATRTPMSPLTVGLEGFAAGDVSQGLQLLLQQALGQQVPHKVPQYGPAIRRGVNPGDLGSGQDGAAG